MTWATHGKVLQPLGEVQNVQPPQYHASLLKMQYLTQCICVCIDDIATVLRWEGPITSSAARPFLCVDCCGMYG